MSRSAVLAGLLAMAVVLLAAVCAYSIEECPDQEHVPEGDRRVDSASFNISVIYGHPLQFHELDGDLLAQVQGMSGAEAIDYVIWGSFGLANRDNQFPSMIILAQLTNCDELFKLQQHYNDSDFKAYLVPYQSAVQNSHIGLLTKLDPDPSWLGERAISDQWNSTSDCGALYQIPISVNRSRLLILGADLASRIDQRSHCVVDKEDLMRVYEKIRVTSEETQTEILFVVDMNPYWQKAITHRDLASTSSTLLNTLASQSRSYQLGYAAEAVSGSSLYRLARLKVSFGIEFLGPVLVSEGLSPSLQVIRRRLGEEIGTSKITSSALLINVSHLLPIDIQTSPPQFPIGVLIVGVILLGAILIIGVWLIISRRKRSTPDSSRD